MYTPERRARLRSDLLEYAARDRRISGVAITGSAAADQEDAWSDIDLAFGVADGSPVPEVLSDWTAHLYQQHGALHHLDVRAGAWIYRVFLLPDTLQVDLAFVTAAEFRPLGPTFRLVSGTAQEGRSMPSPAPADLIGFGWLYALHARSSIVRDKFWQAEYMISGVRDHALALACLRHGLPTAHGRGMDDLPADVRERFEAALVRSLDRAELTRSFASAVDALVKEIRTADGALGRQLEDTLLQLARLE